MYPKVNAAFFKEQWVLGLWNSFLPFSFSKGMDILPKLPMESKTS